MEKKERVIEAARNTIYLRLIRCVLFACECVCAQLLQKGRQGALLLERTLSDLIEDLALLYNQLTVQRDITQDPQEEKDRYEKLTVCAPFLFYFLLLPSCSDLISCFVPSSLYSPALIFSSVSWCIEWRAVQ
jgi:hypothetical protein